MASKAKFVRFVGNAWLNGKDVAAYKVAEGIRLTPETTGGKIIGASETVSEAAFESLMERWTDSGALHRGDARITQAALSYLGIDSV